MFRRLSLVTLILVFLLTFCTFTGGDVLANTTTQVKIEHGQLSNCVLPVEVIIEDLPPGQDVLGFNLELSFNPALLQYQSFNKGSYFTDVLLWPDPEADNTAGTFKTSLARKTGKPPASSGTTLTIMFQVIDNGTAQFTLPVVLLRDPVNNEIPLTKQGAQAQLTGCPVVVPTVTTSEASSVTSSTAALNGSITITGGENCDQRKFQYKQQGAATWTDAGMESGSFGIGTFNYILTGLSNAKTYEYKALAHNSAGWGEGAVQTFSTLDATGYQKGDVNGDGVTNVQDVVLTVNIILGKTTPAGEMFNAADANSDGVINVQDVVKIVNIVLGKG